MLSVLVLVVAVLVAACGGGGQPSSGGGSSSGDAGGSDQGDQAGGEQLQPVQIRIVADFAPPPFNAAVAIQEFIKKLEERIPGSKGQAYFAGSLYPTESDALEAMVAGNLEMIFGQYGKAAGFEPRMNLVVQPGNYTTIAAQRKFPETETAAYLRQVMSERGIETIGNAHLSFYLSIGSRERIRTLDDIRGKKIRSMDPLVGNTVLTAWGASPVTMAFGEVPSALQTGTIDALATSVGGWLVVKDQAPYFNVFGVGGMQTDMYYIGVSKRWWDGLNEPTKQAIRELVAEMTELSDQLTYCDDQMAVKKYGTEDPDQEGIYFLTEEEKAPFREALGNKVVEVLKSKLPSDSHEWIDRFGEEGRALSQQYPEGSDPLEQTDCEALFQQFNRTIN